MLYENEVLMLLISVIVLIFAIIYFKTLSRIPHWRYLMGSYALLMLGWLFTILEGFLFHLLFDYLEHIFYMLGSLCIFLWIWKSTQLSSKA
ncbi:hypothetical protein BGP76_07790 [Reichenbachiella sp. MSK19-1]|nr:hypothetical protein BGP76_07790 [Reichenbachiella sp. MSK19-1]